MSLIKKIYEYRGYEVETKKDKLNNWQARVELQENSYLFEGYSIEAAVLQCAEEYIDELIDVERYKKFKKRYRKFKKRYCEDNIKEIDEQIKKIEEAAKKIKEICELKSDGAFNIEKYRLYYKEE